MVRLPIALQLYSVRDFLEQDFADTIRKVKAMGYDGVEFAGLYGNSPADVKAICADAGVVPVSAHVPFGDLLNETEKTLAAYAEIGTRYVVVPYLPEEFRPHTGRFPEFIECVRRIGAAAADHGLKLGYHNHDFEFAKIGDKYALDLLYETVPAELLDTQLDVCWIKVAGECPVSYIKKYAGRTHLVHLKDFAGSRSSHMYELIGDERTKFSKTEEKNTFEFRPVGKGLQDFPPILAASEEVGAEWLIVEQDLPSMGMNALECAETSIRYLKALK